MNFKVMKFGKFAKITQSCKNCQKLQGTCENSMKTNLKKWLSNTIPTRLVLS